MAERITAYEAHAAAGEAKAREAAAKLGREHISASKLKPGQFFHTSATSPRYQLVAKNPDSTATVLNTATGKHENHESLFRLGNSVQRMSKAAIKAEEKAKKLKSFATVGPTASAPTPAAPAPAAPAPAAPAKASAHLEAEAHQHSVQAVTPEQHRIAARKLSAAAVEHEKEGNEATAKKLKAESGKHLKAWLTGKNGGIFYISDTGKKVYRGHG